MNTELQKPFVVVEGLDGTGKSTLTEVIAEHIGGIRIATPMEPHRSMRPEYRETTFSPRDSFDFYLDAVRFASEQISITCQVLSVVCDRYIASTYAYHTGMGLDPEYATQKIADSKILMPSVSFLLDARNEVLTQRLANPDRRSKPLKIEWLEKIRSAYQNFDFVKIDTSDIDQQEVAEVIIRTLQERNLI